MRKNNVLDILRIAAVLCLICGIMAGLLAVINGLTKTRIAANEKQKETEAIAAIFGDTITVGEDIQTSSPVDKLAPVMRDGKLLGYAVSVTGSGVGGDIDMIVGVAEDGTVLGVQILTLSETPGLGARVAEDSFLSRFTQSTPPYSVGENIDAVAGATISSRAVAAAVNAAVEAAQNVEG